MAAGRVTLERTFCDVFVLTMRRVAETSDDYIELLIDTFHIFNVQKLNGLLLLTLPK
jgi:hypothetical protein